MISRILFLNWKELPPDRRRAVCAVKPGGVAAILPVPRGGLGALLPERQVSLRVCGVRSAITPEENRETFAHLAVSANRVVPQRGFT